MKRPYKYPPGRPVAPWSCTSHLAVYVSLYIENWYVYRFPPAHYGEPPYKLTLGTDSLAICSQNRLWYPKLLCPARSAHVGVGTHILHPRRPKPPPRASHHAEKSENAQKRYETGRPYLNFGRLRSLCGPPKSPHGHIWPRQRLAHLRVDVEGRHERLYRPRPRTRDRTTAVLTSDL